MYSVCWLLHVGTPAAASLLFLAPEPVLQRRRPLSIRSFRFWLARPLFVGCCFVVALSALCRCLHYLLRSSLSACRYCFLSLSARLSPLVAFLPPQRLLSPFPALSCACDRCSFLPLSLSPARARLAQGGHPRQRATRNRSYYRQKQPALGQVWSLWSVPLFLPFLLVVENNPRSEFPISKLPSLLLSPSPSASFAPTSPKILSSPSPSSEFSIVLSLLFPCSILSTNGKTHPQRLELSLDNPSLSVSLSRFLTNGHFFHFAAPGFLCAAIARCSVRYGRVFIFRALVLLFAPLPTLFLDNRQLLPIFNLTSPKKLTFLSTKAAHSPPPVFAQVIGSPCQPPTGTNYTSSPAPVLRLVVAGRNHSTTPSFICSILRHKHASESSTPNAFSCLVEYRTYTVHRSSDHLVYLDPRRSL